MEGSKRTLLQRAFNNEEVSRVPIGFWHHFILGEDQFRGLEDPSLLERAYAGHVNYYKTVNPDMMKLMNEGFFGYPPIMDNALRTGEDLLKIKAIGPDHPWIVKQVAYVKRLAAAFSDEVMTFYNVFAPLQIIRIRLEFLDMDFERFAFLADQYPEQLRAAGLEIQKDVIALIELLFKETSLDGIYYCVQNIQSDQYTAETYREYIEPTERKALDVANRLSDNTILHICGYARHVNDFATYKEYEAKVYNWAVHTEHISLQEGKAYFNNHCVLGGFDNNLGTLIDTGTQPEIEAYVQELIAENGYKGFVIGADCSIPNGIDDHQVRMISDASYRFIQER